MENKTKPYDAFKGVAHIISCTLIIAFRWKDDKRKTDELRSIIKQFTQTLLDVTNPRWMYQEEARKRNQTVDDMRNDMKKRILAE